MPLPSIQVMGIAAKGDPSLFETLMAQAGFRVTPRDNNPLNDYVQEEAVAAVASAITEDAYHGVRLSPYHRKLKTLAEQAGYIVMVENCGPPGADPCAGDEMPIAEVGEGEAMLAAGGGEEMDVPPVEDEVSPEVQQVASLPIGTELAAEILAVLNGEGPAALEAGDEFGDEGLHGEMPMGGDEFGGEGEFGPEEGGEELPPAPGGEEEFGPEEGGEELPPAPGGEGEEDETRPF